MASSSGSGGGVEGGVGEGPTTLDELYQINVVPAELHFKFRKELQGLRVGLNLEVLYSYLEDSYQILNLAINPRVLDVNVRHS
jgi:hypothetical protein